MAAHPTRASRPPLPSRSQPVPPTLAGRPLLRISQMPSPPPAARTGSNTEGKNLGLALAIISTAQVMIVLDTTIVNVALPTIQRSLHFSAANLQWLITAYALTFGGLLLFGAEQATCTANDACS